MKITRKYLLNRRSKLKSVRNEKASAYNQNQIVMVEANRAISEMNNNEDEALEMFSPKVREDNGFSKQEINELKTKIATLAQQNIELHKEVKNADAEISVITQSLNEVSINIRIINALKKEKDEYVSRETYEMENENLDPDLESMDINKEVNIEKSDMCLLANEENQGEMNAERNIDDDWNEEYSKLIEDEEKGVDNIEEKQMERRELISKLNLCKQLLNTDRTRAAIEIGELIKNIEKEVL